MTLALRQFRDELIKLFARKRTWAGFGIFIGIELLIFVLLNYPPVFEKLKRDIDSQGVIAADFMGGVTIGFIVFLATSVIGIVFLSLVSGDIVAKEIEDGTMRMTLCRPVSRLRILAVKYAATVVHHFVFIFFVGLSMLAIGVGWLGVKGFFVFVPSDELLAIFPADESIARYLLMLPCFAGSLLVVSSFGFLFSCCDMKPVVATVLAIVVILIDRILYELPYFNAIKKWFIHYRILKWGDILREHIQWDQIASDYLWMLAFNATLFVLAVTVFSRRDFKS